MREIKFRAWDKKRKWMVDVICLNMGHWFDIILKYPERNETYNQSILDVEVIQYTGLNDKNGVEIYEGDVIEFEDGTIDHIVWDSEFQFHTKSNLDNSQSNMNEVEARVIGNIHKNPELLDA